LSRDQMKAGRNWYSYCGNNPTGRADPTGNITLIPPWKWEGGGGYPPMAGFGSNPMTAGASYDGMSIWVHEDPWNPATHWGAPSPEDLACDGLSEGRQGLPIVERIFTGKHPTYTGTAADPEPGYPIGPGGGTQV